MPLFLYAIDPLPQGLQRDYGSIPWDQYFSALNTSLARLGVHVNVAVPRFLAKVQELLLADQANGFASLKVCDP